MFNFEVTHESTVDGEIITTAIDHENGWTYYNAAKTDNFSKVYTAIYRRGKFGNEYMVQKTSMWTGRGWSGDRVNLDFYPENMA